MTVTLYKNNSDRRFLNKNITELLNYSEIKILDNNDSITAPVLVVSAFVPTANYCYIAEFNRYYYIENTEVMTANRWKITCKCDVLMSFKNDIKNASGILARSNTLGNVKLNDNMSAVMCEDTLTNLVFNGCELLQYVSAANKSFIMFTFGGQNITNGGA